MFFNKFLKKKIFLIGANKTGTTSMEVIFRKLKYKIPKQWEQEKELKDAFLKKDINKIKKFIDKFEFFQDVPISKLSNYVILDFLYPHAKFILTVRNEDEWVESFQKFKLKHFRERNRDIKNIDDITEQMFLDIDYIYPGYIHETAKRYNLQDLKNCKLIYDFNLFKNKEFLKKVYTARNLEIAKYFQLRKNKLLIIDITKEKDISKILEFCNISNDKNFLVPHLNSSI